MTLFPDLPEVTGAIAEPTDADYAHAARYALERNQLPRAIEQVAGALALAPETRSHRELLERIAGKARRPLELLALREEGSFYGLAAARAWWLLRAGEVDEAVELLAEVVAFHPNARFLAWLTDGVLGDGGRVPVGAVIRLLQALTDAVEREPFDAAGIDNVSMALRLAAEMAGRADVSRDPTTRGALLSARVQLLRFTGNDAPALELATGDPPCWEGAVLAALIHRDRGEPRKRLQALRSGCALRPDEPSSWLDRASVAAQLGELDEALDAFARATDCGGGVFAEAAHAWLSFAMGDEAARQRLLKLDATPPVRALQRDAEAYERLVLDPFDTVVRVVRTALGELRRRPGQAIHLEAKVDGPVPLSALVAFHLGAHGRAASAKVTIVGSNGAHHASANRHPRPADEGASTARLALSQLAHSRFSFEGWRREAAEHVDLPPASVLEAMRSPPEAPADADAVQWVTHVQVAGAMVLGQHAEAAAQREALLDDDDAWLRIAGLIAWRVALESGLVEAQHGRARLALCMAQELDAPSAAARSLSAVGHGCLPDERPALAKLRARCLFSLLEGA